MRAAAAVLLLHIAHAKAPDHHHDYALNATLTHPIELACLKQVRLRGDLGLAPADRSLYSYNPSVRRVDGGGYLYLARVTNLHGCDAARAARPATVVDGLFALALLDDGLSVVPRSEALVPLPGLPPFADCRLGPRDAVLCNDVIFAVSFERIAAAPRWACDARLECPSGAASLDPPATSVVAAVDFRDGVRYAFSAPARLEGLGDGAKNVNLFERAGKLYAEAYPVVKREILELENGTLRAARAFAPPAVAGAPPSRRDVDRNSPERDAQLRRVWHRGILHRAEPRGGACCVEMADAFLGVGHYRGRGSQYVLFAYAFSKTPPFALAALGEPFCLPSRDATPRLLRSACPRIAMATGIVKHDDNSVLLGVGANDCAAYVAPLRVAVLASTLRPIGPLPD